MGKSLSFKQADFCRNRSKVILAIQNDEASNQFRTSVMGKFRDLGIPVTVVNPPEKYEDYGDMSQELADEFRESLVKKYSL
jgi:hypothetical protein